MTKHKRNSNIELLRILCMIFIVVHHYASHGFNIAEMPYSFNKYLLACLSLGGKLGVVLFVIISGYYMVDSKITVKKIAKIIGEVYFYSVGILILFILMLKPVTFIGITDIVKSLLPIGYEQYWFMTDYIILMIMSPILNILINS